MVYLEHWFKMTPDGEIYRMSIPDPIAGEWKLIAKLNPDKEDLLAKEPNHGD